MSINIPKISIGNLGGSAGTGGRFGPKDEIDIIGYESGKMGTVGRGGGSDVSRSRQNNTRAHGGGSGQIAVDQDRLAYKSLLQHQKYQAKVKRWRAGQI